jgi:hypothetical protein
MKYYEHPSYIGEVTSLQPSERIIYQEQYDKLGFDETCLYNFDITIAKFLYPRLEQFQIVCKKCIVPTDLTNEEWKDILEEMTLGFKEFAENPDCERDLVKRSFELLAQYYSYLWS